MDKYTTVLGDTFDHIAFKAYGDVSHMNKVIEANLKHRKVIIFQAGIELNIPKIINKPNNNLPPWKRVI